MEDRVVKGLNVLAGGLGWKVKLGEKQAEKTRETAEKTDIVAENVCDCVADDKQDDDKYEALVHDVIGHFPRYVSIRHPDSVFVGNSFSRVDAEKFSKCLRKIFDKYCYNDFQSLNSGDKHLINSSLSKANISKGELWLIINSQVGWRDKRILDYISDGTCYTIFVKDIENDFIDYELIDGFKFSKKAYFDRKILQNRLQIKEKLLSKWWKVWWPLIIFIGGPFLFLFIMFALVAETGCSLFFLCVFASLVGGTFYYERGK